MRNKPHARRVAVTFCITLLPGLAAATMYRWVDEKGEVHYSDVLPSRQTGMGHTELNKQGRVTKVAPRTLLSAEERRRKTEEEAAQAEHMRRVEEQQRRDRALLSTYANLNEIDLARERALVLEQLTLNSLQSRMDTSASKLAFANRQLDRYRAAGSREPANFVQMRDEAQSELAQLGDSIRQRQKSIDELKVRFDDDKTRFQELLELKSMSR